MRLIQGELSRERMPFAPPPHSWVAIGRGYPKQLSVSQSLRSGQSGDGGGVSDILGGILHVAGLTAC